MHILSPLLILLSLLIAVPANASKISISLKPNDTNKMPASDLVYQGKQIDEVDALEFINQGIDLSQLSPKESHLWKKHKLSVSNQNELGYPKNQTMVFKQLKSSPREIFRSVVHVKNNYNKQFVLVASLDNHTNILRATLLRLLGYDIDVPKFYKELKVQFKSLAEKKQFIELVGEQTLTKRTRWIKKDLSDTELLVKGFTLEPVKLRNVNIHLPLMSRVRQQDRRVFRALLDIYALTDFTQEINKVAWKTGRLFNGKLILNHPYAAEFKNTTIDDMRWIHRGLNALKRSEIVKAISFSNYPKDIQELLTEKLLSRINKLSEYLKLASTFKVNSLLTTGDIVAGELTKKSKEQELYVLDFYNEDEESPYRFKELFKLFRTQIVYSSLSNLLDQALQKFIPGKYYTDAIADVQAKIQDYRQNNTSGSSMPLKSFISPIANGRTFANRNIIFGQYLGSSAPIQLVDSVGVEANLGLFGSITGISNTVLPNISASVSIGRTYTHVRAMPDLSTASSQSVKKIFVPGLLKKLGRVIKDEFDCSIPKLPYSEEDSLSGKPIYYIKYDTKLTDGRDLAIAKRQELIDSGISASVILIVPIDREKLCVTQVATNRTNNISEFLKEFANNETFIINDTIRLSGSTSAPIPIPNVPGMSINLGSDHNIALLRSIMIRKVNNTMEISIQQQRDIRNGLSQGLTYFIELLRNSNQWTKGRLYSKVFRIKLDNLTEDQEIIALQTLRSLFVNNDRYNLEDHYRPYDLDHRVKASLHTFRVLWFKKQKMKMDHVLDLIVPQIEGQDFSQEERTRKLYSTLYFKRKGNDFYSFIDRAVRSLVGFVSIGSNDADPGQTFMGKSTKNYYSTESELTKKYPLNPTTRIEYIWTGWKRKTHKLNKYFVQIEDMFTEFTDTQLIDRTKFYGSPLLRSYDIRSTIIIYPSAFEKIKRSIIQTSETTAMNTLYHMYGEENWQNFCERAIDFFGDNGPQTYYGEKDYACVPPGVKEVLSLRKKMPNLDERKKLTKKINLLYKTLFEEFDKAKVLKWIGAKNFFSSSRVTGFREQHHAGYIDYISDTIGEYNLKIGTGLFDSIGAHLGLSPYELKAMSYTPGM